MDLLEQLRAGKLAGSHRLKLSMGLREFPREIFELADTLEILDLSGNQLMTLPDDLPRLRHLRVLFCSDNPFEELPAVLGRCQRLSMIGFKACRISSVPASSLPLGLRWLILTDNRIATIPAEIGQCRQLQKLMLAGNSLQALPPELVNCQSLELLRISANLLPTLPDWLARMPRLAWLAFSGNPVCAADELRYQAGSTPVISWASLKLGDKLGEGASGHIYQVQQQRDGQTMSMALKLFKGQVTSDGLPRSEMAACIGAGNYPQLIPLLGMLLGHPLEQHGLLMALIDPEYRVLAGPPSLESCTRDVYAADLHFNIATVLRLVAGVAMAIAHLHQRGILHGDVYAHNILYLPDGQVLLSDFGAASCMPSDSDAWQRLEVRAFGLLLQELLQRCRFDSTTEGLLSRLEGLQQRCIQGSPAARPLFDEISAMLTAWLSGCA